MIQLRILELFHHPYLGIGLRAVILILPDLLRVVVGILIDLRTVVDIEPQRMDARGADKLHLLGLLVTQRSGTLERI